VTSWTDHLTKCDKFSIISFITKNKGTNSHSIVKMELELQQYWTLFIT